MVFVVGIGHAGKVDGVGSCLTARLGHRIDHKDLARISYPDGYNAPRFMYKPKNSFSKARAAERENDSDEYESDDDAAANSAAKQVKFKPRNKSHRMNPKFNKRPQPRRARQVNEDSKIDKDPPSDGVAQNSECDAYDNESDRDEHHSRLAVEFDSIKF